MLKMTGNLLQIWCDSGSKRFKIVPQRNVIIDHLRTQKGPERAFSVARFNKTFSFDECIESRSLQSRSNQNFTGSFKLIKKFEFPRIYIVD
jgi:hypothetical protein